MCDRQSKRTLKSNQSPGVSNRLPIDKRNARGETFNWQNITFLPLTVNHLSNKQSTIHLSANSMEVVFLLKEIFFLFCRFRMPITHRSIYLILDNYCTPKIVRALYIIANLAAPYIKELAPAYVRRFLCVRPTLSIRLCSSLASAEFQLFHTTAPFQ